MAAERTIAIIGEKGKFCPALAEKLAQQNLHLLFISNDEEQNEQIKRQFEKKDHAAKIEFIQCEKEGCWEADVIAFTHPEKISSQLIHRIREVATQKIILIISEEKRAGNNEYETNFEDLLPHSRVVYLIINAENLEVQIFGKDMEARQMVEGFFSEVGYKI